MGAQRRNVGGRGAWRDHHRDRIARHDAQQHEDDDRHAQQGDGGHDQAIGGDRIIDALDAGTGEGAENPCRSAPPCVHAFDTRVGCSAPVPFGVTLSDDL